MEAQYKFFRKECGIFKEAVLDIKSFKENFPNISFQNEELYWSATQNPLNQYLPKPV